MRIRSIDALRGFAVLGILIMNMPAHQNILTGYVNFAPSLISDEIILFLQAIFADGRFRSLFCLLFGMGMAIQYESCQRKQINPRDFLKSRLNWLLIFGIFHATFVFGGDILMLYSLTGMMLIKRLSLDQEQMWRRGWRHFIVGSIATLILFALIILEPSEPMTRTSEDYLESIAVWQSGYTAQATSQASYAFLLLLFSPLFLWWQALGLMMLGAYLYREGFCNNGLKPNQLKLFTVLAVVTTAISSCTVLLFDKIDYENSPFLASISAVFVALLYAHGMVKLCRKENWLTSLLTACGKAAFTLYLMQSIVLAVLFRAVLPIISPAFHETITMLDNLLITVAFWAIQIAFALWLQRIGAQGPFEKLWRKLYLKSLAKKLAKQQTPPATEAEPQTPST